MKRLFFLIIISFNIIQAQVIGAKLIINFYDNTMHSEDTIIASTDTSYYIINEKPLLEMYSLEYLDTFHGFIEVGFVETPYIFTAYHYTDYYGFTSLFLLPDEIIFFLIRRKLLSLGKEY